jgi:fatty acid kinase fatty acid binding subunit
MGVTIVSDTGNDLTREEASRYGIEIVPIYILFGTERLRDGVDIDRATFYRRLAAGEAVTTEPASPQDYKTIFERAIAGGNDVVMISLSSQISKSFEHATAAAASFGGKVKVVDSRAAGGLETLLAIYAAERAKAGDGADEIVRKLDAKRLKTAAYFAVPNMTSLGKSGRLPKAVVALGSMLNVSLVLKMNEAGAIAPGGQSRSFDKTSEIMVDAVVRTIERSPGAWVAFSHVHAADTVAKLKKTLEEKLGHPPLKEFVHESTLTIATHMGEGGVGIFAIVP